jgi:nitrogenase molybdenum-iron protein alpha/beta subunit/MoaA/NifB/PqqE/SkfB family radical SAM enzyme
MGGNKNYTNLTVNPCKMCMPLGAVTAFYGIEGCMSIIHGSQGCSTYIRRHMATHYNEPIDIASSSLTEQGTVYGGEQNLIAGIKNLVRQYSPKVVGVATTCLAETIGEDVPRILQKLKYDPDCADLELVSVASPGYGGTQFEGFLAATLAVVKQFADDKTPNSDVNIVATYMSPAEMRYIKDLFDAFGLTYILVPDISDNLDNVYNPVYSKLPQRGTKILDIHRMAGARFTVEIGLFSGEYSAARYLNKEFGVPFESVPLPVGLRATDRLIKLLSRLSGRPVPEHLKRQRGRYLDAMVDAHKYCGEARAVIYGEPETVYAVTNLCCECGVFPAVVACGSKCKELNGLLGDDISKISAVRLESRYDIIDEADFDKIAQLIKDRGLNLMIGNSDGRRVAEKLPQVTLVRTGFPVHDRVGGQRQLHVGYEGSLRLMDEIANAMLNRRETTYRKELFDKYYNGGVKPIQTAAPSALTPEKVKEKTKTHPCYDCSACGSARIHLPVAPACNIQCNYCSRKFDCANESRPGVTSGVLSPEEAVKKYLEVKKKVPNLSVVGIAGPGDALANFEKTKETLLKIRAVDPDVTFCLSTNGLMLPFYAASLVEIGVSHVTVTVNAADEATGAKIYRFVNYFGKQLKGEEAARTLLNNQLSGIRFLSAKGVAIKVNIVLLKGINDGQIDRIVKTVKDCGAMITNIMQLIPVKGCPFETLELPSNKELNLVRKNCGEILPQMYHCRQCRADAIGTLDNDISIDFRGSENGEQKDGERMTDEEQVLRFAVASKSGMIVDSHFGHAKEFYIYECSKNEVRFVEKRAVSKYCGGPECDDDQEDKIDGIIEKLGDCDGIICMRIGVMPGRILQDKGIAVFSIYDRVEDSVRKAAQLLAEMPERNIVKTDS